MKTKSPPPPRSVVILGAGGQGRVVANIFTLLGCTEISFLDDQPSSVLNIVGKLADFPQHQNAGTLFHVALGDNILRKRWYGHLLHYGCTFANAVHPSAHLEPSVRLGNNVMIGAHAVINIDTTVGDNTIINTAAILEHDNQVGQHVFIAPRVALAGGVHVHDEVFIGIGVVVAPNRTLATGCRVGAGAVVLGDVTEPGLYVGVPARKKA